MFLSSAPPSSPLVLSSGTPGLERDKFDNKTVSFEEHIKAEHNMWHYLYFLVLVRVKDPTEYTGPESYVAYMIKVSGPGAWGRGPGGPSGYARTHARTHAHRGVHYVGGPFMDGWLSLVFVC